MEKMEIMTAGEVVEFIVGSLEHLVFGDEGHPGLEVGFDKKTRKIVAYMCLNFVTLYPRILKGLTEKPIPGRFSVETVEDIDTVTTICDPRVKNATFAEIVEWLWEKYYAHLELKAKIEANA